MKHLILAALILSFLASLSLSAADPKGPAKAPKKPAKEATSTKPQHLPLQGTVIAITTRTLTLKGAAGKEDRKFKITKDTLIQTGDTVTTTDAIKPGQAVTGAYLRDTEGDTLVSLQLKPTPKPKPAGN